MTGDPHAALLKPLLRPLRSPAVVAGSDLPDAAGGPGDREALRPPGVRGRLPAGRNCLPDHSQHIQTEVCFSLTEFTLFTGVFQLQITYGKSTHKHPLLK